MTTVRGTAPAAVVVVMLLAGCGGGGGTGTSAPASPAATGAAPRTDITVFAAASLTGSFDTVGEEFEQAHGVDVQFTYAGSSDLEAQLGQGAPGSVFASANEKQMAVAVENGSVPAGSERIFATNTLTVVTPAANPAGVGALADLATPGVSTVVCAPQVPCGAATVEMATDAGVELTPVSEEQSVTDVLGKVTSGQADAGIVYVTDAARAGDAVHVVDTPEAQAVVNRYPIAVTAYGAQDAARAATAQAFVDFVVGERGRAVLGGAGFGAP